MADIIVAGNTSGSVTLSAPAISGSSVLTLPVATDTLVGKATTDTLTNKTLTSPTINSLSSASATALTLQSAGTTAITVDTSQNVGIGNAGTSVYKLYVTGSIGATGSLTVGSNGTYVAGSIYSDANWGIIFRAKQASPTTADFMWANSSDVERMRIDISGGLILAGSTAQKATGTTWSNPSDQRIKDNIRDYTKGTTELMQVRVREWEYNGKGGTTEGMKGLGVVADEVMTVLPNTVETYDAKLNADDKETTAIKKFDATEITWLLVKTVQEQQAIIIQLQADVAALKGATA